MQIAIHAEQIAALRKELSLMHHGEQAELLIDIRYVPNRARFRVSGRPWTDFVDGPQPGPDIHDRLRDVGACARVPTKYADYCVLVAEHEGEHHDLQRWETESAEQRVAFPYSDAAIEVLGTIYGQS